MAAEAPRGVVGTVQVDDGQSVGAALRVSLIERGPGSEVAGFECSRGEGYISAAGRYGGRPDQPVDMNAPDLVKGVAVEGGADDLALLGRVEVMVKVGGHRRGGGRVRLASSRPRDAVSGRTGRGPALPAKVELRTLSSDEMRWRRRWRQSRLAGPGASSVSSASADAERHLGTLLTA